MRAFTDDKGNPWFVAKDVCTVLELDNTTKATRVLDAHEKGITKVHTLGGNQNLITISESGLYKLIMRSNKPQAKPFQNWVTQVVLPP